MIKDQLTLFYKVKCYNRYYHIIKLTCNNMAWNSLLANMNKSVRKLLQYILLNLRIWLVLCNSLISCLIMTTKQSTVNHMYQVFQYHKIENNETLWVKASKIGTVQMLINGEIGSFTVAAMLSKLWTSICPVLVLTKEDSANHACIHKSISCNF